MMHGSNDFECRGVPSDPGIFTLKWLRRKSDLEKILEPCNRLARVLK